MIGYKYISDKGIRTAQYPEKYRAILAHSIKIANRLANDDKHFVLLEPDEMPKRIRFK